jgi:hypothetical protein
MLAEEQIKNSLKNSVKAWSHLCGIVKSLKILSILKNYNPDVEYFSNGLPTILFYLILTVFFF